MLDGVMTFAVAFATSLSLTFPIRRMAWRRAFQSSEEVFPR